MGGRQFRRRGDAVTVRLADYEVFVLRSVTADMPEMIAAPPEGEVRDRLYPRAYLDHGEESAESEFQSLVHDDLVQSRLDAIAVVASALETIPSDPPKVSEVVLEPGAEMAWVTALNDARLVLGTALGVTEDDDGLPDRDDPRFETALVYRLLTALHAELVDLLLDELGTGGTDDF